MASMDWPAYLTAWRGVRRVVMSDSAREDLAPATPVELTFNAFTTESKILQSI